MMKNELKVSMSDLIPIIKNAIENGNSIEFTPTGSSMEPLLHGGISLLRLVKLNQPKRGDMVLFQRSSGDYVLHRIYKKEKDGRYTFLGDNQTTLEKNIKEEQLIAQVSEYNSDGVWVSCNNQRYIHYWKKRLYTRLLRKVIKHFLNKRNNAD